MNDMFKKQLVNDHKNCTECPTNEEVISLFKSYISLLYPHFQGTRIQSERDFDRYSEELGNEAKSLFLRYPSLCVDKIDQNTNELIQFLPQLHSMLNKDIQAIFEEDPAAKSKEEVIRCYPGFYAIAAYRFAHKLLELGIKLIPRIITEHAHSHTSIDIHPGAEIGEHFCIDHGTGVVIGESTIIGNHVKLYQGVTLGALSVDKDDADKKRHPTIEDNVLIYSNATILGGNTIIGANSKIGGNVWITESVPPNSKVYYVTGENQVYKM